MAPNLYSVSIGVHKTKPDGKRTKGGSAVSSSKLIFSLLTYLMGLIPVLVIFFILDMTEVEATIDSLNTRFHQSLIDLKEITHKSSRLEHINYMNELVDEALYLHQHYSQLLHPLVTAKLNHIIALK